MIIGSYKRIPNIENQNEINIRLVDKEINRTNSSKSLGFIIDEHLRWKEQIDSISIIKSYWNYSTSKKICFTRYIRTNVSFFSSPVFRLLFSCLE